VCRCRARILAYGSQPAMPDAKDEIDPRPSHASLPSARWSVADTLLLAVLSLLALGLRLLAIEQWSFGVAEAETFRALTQPLSGGPDGYTASDQSSYPAVFLLLRWLLEIGVLPSFTEGWIRLPFAFAGCLLVPGSVNDGLGDVTAMSGRTQAA
jgi:hypothetical protein